MQKLAVYVHTNDGDLQKYVFVYHVKTAKIVIRYYLTRLHGYNVSRIVIWQCCFRPVSRHIAVISGRVCINRSFLPFVFILRWKHYS